MRYQVTFTKYYFYDVEGHDVDTAIDEAYKLFRSEMTCPIADTSYDQLDIEPLDEEEEDVSMTCKDCLYYYRTKEQEFPSCQWVPRCPGDYPPCEEEDYYDTEYEPDICCEEEEE